jgi:3-hydroxyacyl-CoA dehydrogenase
MEFKKTAVMGAGLRGTGIAQVVAMGEKAYVNTFKKIMLKGLML